MKRILIVCTGNTCRSPMAEGIMKKCARDHDLDIAVMSAGICCGGELSATENATKAVAEFGVDILGHSPKNITDELVDEADLVLTMTRSHKKIIIDGFGAPDKTYTIMEYAYGLDRDVVDPFGGDLNVYRSCAKELFDAINTICYKKLREI